MSLKYSPACVPYGPLVCALESGLAVTATEDGSLPRDAPPVLTLPSGEVLTGGPACVRHCAKGAAGLQGGNAEQVDAWVEFSGKLVAGAGFEAALKELADALASGRPMLVEGTSTPTAADVAVWGALCCAPKLEAVLKKNPAVAKWNASVVAALPSAARALDDYMPAAAKAAKEKVAAAKAARAAAAAAAPPESAAAAAADKGKDEGGSFDIGLKDAKEGAVVTRFPPEPSGFLHIGHAKAALLNEYFARQYKGQLIVRFDDTNPSKENEDFVAAILADVATLGIVPDRITYTSDHFPALLAMGEQLIRSGHMYGDCTPVEEMRAGRMDGIESAFRANSVAENLRLWGEMNKGSPEGLTCCMRFKINMCEPNKAMRDPVAFRCNVEHPHHRTGSTYTLYPTYDCACPFVDAVEGVTHALRTSEYRDREAQYDWIQAAMGVRKVHIWDYSRLNFEYTTLSKRKLGAFVEAGKVDGWDDPRFPTVQGVMRRGLTVSALREFILSQGASRNLNTMTWEKLWTMNKRVIDPVCPRHTCVEGGHMGPGTGRVLFQLTNVPLAAGGAEARTVPRHKKHPPAGEKTQWRSAALWLDAVDAASLSVGEELTLMDWGNAIVDGVQRMAGEGGALGRIVGLTGRLHLEGDVKSTKLKAHWLAHAPDTPAARPTPLVLRELDHLITKRKVEDGDDVASLFNAVSDARREAIGDSDMAKLVKGDVLQLERKGYWIVDQAAGERDPVTGACASPAVLIGIPDGREKK